MAVYDLIIVGGGPAGMSAGVYAGNYKLKAVVLAEAVGGSAINAAWIENYSGYERIPGVELMMRMKAQVEKWGVKVIQTSVADIKKKGNFILTDAGKKKYEAKAVVLATGMERRKLGVPGEKEYIGKGVAYCATCDAAMFRDKLVAVVGGSNAAAESALLLSEYAKKVYILYRQGQLPAKPMLVERIKKNDKIEILYSTSVKEIKGTKFVESVTLDSGGELKVQGVFIEIGGIPSVGLAKQLGVKLDETESIIVDSAQKTSVEGVFAAGDITTGSNKLRQVVTATAEGAIAATSAYDYIKTK